MATTGFSAHGKGKQTMIRLALIGQTKTAESYGAIHTRLRRASWIAFATLAGTDGPASQTLDQAAIITSADKLFADHASDFDAVVIDADSNQATKLAKIAIAAGKSVLAGPLLTETSLLGQSGILFMPAHAWRFLPMIRSVKRSLDAGKLGDAGLLRIHRWLPAETAPESLTERILPDADLACWMFNGTPEKVWTLLSPKNPNYIQFHLGFRNGAMAMIDIAGSLPTGSDYFSLSMIGSTGATYADDHYNMNLLYTGGQPNALRTGQGRTDLVGQLQEFVDAIGDQRPASVTLDDAARASIVTEQIIESANSDQGIEQKNNY